MTDRTTVTTSRHLRPTRRTLLKTSAASATLALFGGISPNRTNAQSATPAANSPVAGRSLADLDVFVTAQMAELHVPGVAVGVIWGDQTSATGYGITNVDHPLPVDTETFFQIGSTTKTITGTTVMRLVEAGKLDLDAPVRQYLPDFRVADAAVSEGVLVRHLVTHTAGWFGDDFTDTGAGDDALANYVEEMADLPQIAPLGDHFSYNNAAVVLLGRVIEVVTGQPYESAVKDLVLAPLGMDHSFFFANDIITGPIAAGHDAPDGAPVVTGPWAFPRAIGPAGGIVSTIEDMLRYARFHLGDGTAGETRLLTAASMARMRTPLGPGGALGPDLLDGVGVNWLLSTVGGQRVIQHGGSTNGQQTTCVLVPEQGFGIVVLTNANLGAVLGTKVASWTLAQYLGLENAPLPEQSLTEEETTAVVGTYGDLASISLDVTAQSDGLLASPKLGDEPMPGEEVTLRFVGDDRFASDYHGMTVYTDAVRDSSGQIAWLRFSGRLMPKRATYS